jgi:exodeoxyribonuclease VII small subunit
MADIGNWNEATRELDAIVAYLDSPDVNVDELITKLERGAAIVAALEERLTTISLKVEELAPRVQRAEEADEA